MKPDVLIVGAGPAGMSAAITLADAGARVRVVEEQQQPGGQIYRAVERVLAERPDSQSLFGIEYSRGAELVRRFRDSSIEMSAGTSVWDIAGGEPPSISLVDAEGAEVITPRHLVLATGAMERPTPFPGWTLPGVMGVGAAQTLLKESQLVPDGRVVLAGSGPLVLLFARQMIASGVKPQVILDTGRAMAPVELWSLLVQASMVDAPALFKGVNWLREIRAAGVRRLTGVTSLRAIGSGVLQKVEFRRGNDVQEIDADLLLVHDGVIPNTHLAMAAGCEHRWHPVQKYWLPVVDSAGASRQQGISIVGDGAGIMGADAALCSGRLVGLDVARQLGLIGSTRFETGSADDRKRLRKIATFRLFIDQFYPPLASFQVPEDPQTIVCRCEEVTVGDIREVAAMGCMGPNQGKAFTRCGMGPCMGRKCGNTVSQILADSHGMAVSGIGHYRIRPPVRPLTVSQLANLKQAV